MLPTAKVFANGHSQAIRLPKAFRVDVQEMWIAKNEVTGEITLKPKNDDQRKKNLAELFRLIAENPCTEDFIPERVVEPSRNPLEEWAEPLPAKSSNKGKAR